MFTHTIVLATMFDSMSASQDIRAVKTSVTPEECPHLLAVLTSITQIHLKSSMFVSYGCLFFAGQAALKKIWGHKLGVYLLLQAQLHHHTCVLRVTGPVQQIPAALQQQTVEDWLYRAVPKLEHKL